MGQLELFHSTEHLERCFEDPDPYQCEAIYYTSWQILYAGSLGVGDILTKPENFNTTKEHIESFNMLEDPQSTTIGQLRSGDW